MCGGNDDPFKDSFETLADWRAQLKFSRGL
jgi:hypothetical protein